MNDAEQSRISDIKVLLDIQQHEGRLKEDERAIFADMLQSLHDKPRSTLTPKQRELAWKTREKFAPQYQNLVSSGQVPRGKEVEVLPILRPENLPLKPPGKR